MEILRYIASTVLCMASIETQKVVPEYSAISRDSCLARASVTLATGPAESVGEYGALNRQSVMSLAAVTGDFGFFVIRDDETHFGVLRPITLEITAVAGDHGTIHR